MSIKTLWRGLRPGLRYIEPSSSLCSTAFFSTNATDETFWHVKRTPIIAYPQSATKKVPSHIVRPPYADSGILPVSRYGDDIVLHDKVSLKRMTDAARLARSVLDLACSLAKPGVTTDEIDTAVHEAIVEANAYPSPLNYCWFPKSLCSSVNEVICHGIPDYRPLQFGDIVSFDVSCFLNGVHGDNCATVIVGDSQEKDEGGGVDWRGVPYRMQFDKKDDESHFLDARRLVQAARESLYAGIETCKPGSCLSSVGSAIQDVAESYGLSSVEKYRGHGIADEFHIAPYVKHYRNTDKVVLKPGMIFTIEPMLTNGASTCYEWDDDWTVATADGSLAAQFEHTIHITENGVEILTLPE
jgi:methionyl aminopeptidase